VILYDSFFKASLISIRRASSEGPAGAATGFLVLLYALTIRNITRPTTTKLMIVSIQAPYSTAATPASLAASTDDYISVPRVQIDLKNLILQ